MPPYTGSEYIYTYMGRAEYMYNITRVSWSSAAVIELIAVRGI
jgi:hypothetical protein